MCSNNCLQFASEGYFRRRAGRLRTFRRAWWHQRTQQKGRLNSERQGRVVSVKAYGCVESPLAPHYVFVLFSYMIEKTELGAFVEYVKEFTDLISRVSLAVAIN